MSSQNQRKSPPKADPPQAEKLFRMCWNWKGFVVLIGVGIALFVFFPAKARAVAPFLLFALCPISMFFAMRGMKEKGHTDNSCASCEHARQAERNETHS